MTSALSVSLLAAVLAAEPSPETRKALDVYRTASELAAVVGDQVWPGYDARKYLFTLDDRKTGETSVAFSPGGKAATGDVFMTVGGDYFLQHTPEENLSLVFHEAFHAFERDRSRPGARWRVENAFLVFDYATVSPRTQALFAIESRLLQDALQAPAEADARRKARDFLAVRRLRQGELEPRLADFEKGAESNEGLAEYAGTRAVVAGMDAVRQGRAKATFSYLDGPRYLREKYATLRSITRIGKNDRLKFYYTGSAQALLLDRLLPGWKGRVQERAEAVQDLLAEAVGDVPGKEGAEALLRAADYEAVLRQEEEAARRRKADGEAMLKAALDEKGRRLTLDVAALGRVGDYQSFDPMNVTVLDRGRRLHTRMVKVAQPDVYRAEFRQPVLEDRDRKEYVTVLRTADRPTAVLDGSPLDLDAPGRKAITKKLVISTAQFHLEATAGEVEVTREGVRVTPRK